MDKKIIKNDRFISKKGFLIGTSVLVLALAWLYNLNSTSHTEVSSDHISVSIAKHSQIKETIAIRGTFLPSETVYIDAIEGGRVEKVLVEDGSLVSKGDTLIVLSNSSLQLDVISREAQIAEQLNNLQNTQLAIEQNSLSLEKDLARYDYQILQLKRTYKQKFQLNRSGLLSQDDLAKTKEELDYLVKSKELTVKSQKLDKRMRKVQLEQLETSTKGLMENLAFAKKNLDNLVIRSPMNGRLSALNAEVGQSTPRGFRLGQIDDVDRFIIEGEVDEYYLDKVKEGITASARISNQDYSLVISKVYTQVTNGKFKIELIFDHDVPNAKRRGQSIAIDLHVSEPMNTIVINDRGFTHDTGGHWAYVMVENGNFAEKRNIKLGKKDRSSVEVISGINIGEQVIVSTYKNFLDANSLSIIN